MKRSHVLALSGAALLAFLSSPSIAQTISSGMQCVPDVANASMYHNCRLRVVAGQEVCRCAIRPQALRRLDQMRNEDQNDAVTGSINRSTNFRSGQSGEGALGTGAAGGGLNGGGTASNGATGGVAGGGSAGSGSGGSVADNGGTGGGATGGNGNNNGG